MSRRPNRDEEQEKRGVIQYGWTPPAGSRVKLGRHSQAYNELVGGNDQLLVDELDDDITRRLADDVQKKLQ